ncbi:Hypothetical predicted protein [Pelobates cultripes]|uniref:Uncharacterized protein n=1 Tax=Pelobates cultripes TaxID=61616 RepID=A0AAD1SWL4_PELCU|nr:Hypothetical predicted protein [Pelobates cultripes]
MADIQSILQQRAKEATQSRRQRALGGRRDMSPGEESSKDSDSNSHHSPGVPCTSALATPGGATETERKAREKDSEAEWEEEKGEEWKLRVQDRGQGLIKESLLKFGNELGEGSVKERKKKKKKNIARRQPETPVRGSGDSTKEGECSPVEYTYNEEAFPALQTPGARDADTWGQGCRHLGPGMQTPGARDADTWGQGCRHLGPGMQTPGARDADTWGQGCRPHRWQHLCAPGVCPPCLCGSTWTPHRPPW